MPSIKRFPNGNPVVVMRPAKPELARRLAIELLGSADPDALDKVVTEQCGPYDRRGYLGDGGVVVDANANVLEHVHVGDSLVEELE